MIRIYVRFPPKIQTKSFEPILFTLKGEMLRLWAVTLTRCLTELSFSLWSAWSGPRLHSPVKAFCVAKCLAHSVMGDSVTHETLCFDTMLASLPSSRHWTQNEIMGNTQSSVNMWGWGSHKYLFITKYKWLNLPPIYWKWLQIFFFQIRDKRGLVMLQDQWLHPFLQIS